MKVDIKKYAALARIAVSDEEVKKLESDIENILEYVSQVQEADVSIEDTKEVGEIYNVLREDRDPHEEGEYTKELMGEAPETEEKDGGKWLKVKKIL